MSPLALLGALSVIVMLLSQSCDLEGITIDDVSDTIRVTNASTDTPVMALLSTSQGAGQLILRPGESRTMRSLAATTYTVQVASLDGPRVADYRQSLIELRDDLVAISLGQADAVASPEDIVAELGRVTTALAQLESNGLQSCSHAIVASADNHATITWVVAGGISGLWEISCE
jgi:hypothetical protein